MMCTKISFQHDMLHKHINKGAVSLLIQGRGVIKIDTPPSEASIYVLSSPLSLAISL